MSDLLQDPDIDIVTDEFDSNKLLDLPQDSEVAQEPVEEVIEMDGYDTHEVDWSTPKGMTPVPDIIARYVYWLRRVVNAISLFY